MKKILDLEFFSFFKYFFEIFFLEFFFGSEPSSFSRIEKVRLDSQLDRALAMWKEALPGRPLRRTRDGDYIEEY